MAVEKSIVDRITAHSSDVLELKSFSDALWDLTNMDSEVPAWVHLVHQHAHRIDASAQALEEAIYAASKERDAQLPTEVPDGVSGS